MWGWLEDQQDGFTWGFILRVILKAAVLFALCNLVYFALTPLSWLGHITLYGSVFPSRERLPYGENPAQSYNLSLNNLDAMFASTTLTRPKTDNEFRVFLVGDSSTWGWYLQPDETYAANINLAALTLADGRRVAAYNVGYPVLSLTKDLILLDYARRYEPDMVVWLVTAQSMRYLDGSSSAVQTASPVNEWDSSYLAELIAAYDLNVMLMDRVLSPLDHTILGERRDLADLLRLQVYGGVWAATGIDHFVPDDFPLRRTDLEPDDGWATFDVPTELTRNDLAFDVLAAGVDLMGDVPVVIVNQPIYISDGENSEIRYNSFYPRWAYDAYRDLLAEIAAASGWTYADWWDLLPPDAFTDTPVHITPSAATELSEKLTNLILEETHRDE